MMSLNDLNPMKPQKVVLFRLFSDESQGKIEQLSQDMPDDRLWQLAQIANNGLRCQFSLVSSYFWLENFEHLGDFKALSHGDVSDGNE